ncbi:MAG: hypothetical protein ACI4M5_01425 [Christensenellales bacterium]
MAKNKFFDKKTFMSNLNYTGDNANIKTLINDIKNILTSIPDDQELTNLSSIEEFHNNGYFNTSRLVDRNLEEELRDIKLEVSRWVKNIGMELNVRRIKKENKTFRLKCYIAVLVPFAVAALTLTILIACKVIVGEAVETIRDFIGTLDFTLGIIFFLYEVNEDNKSEQELIIGNNLEEIYANELKKQERYPLIGKITNINWGHGNKNVVIVNEYTTDQDNNQNNDNAEDN